MTICNDQSNQKNQQTDLGQLATLGSLPLSSDLNPGQHFQSALGLLDNSAGYPATDSQDVVILRRLKLAILEGQHPYFKANVDLSNLQDVVLATSVSHRSSSNTPQSELPIHTVLAEPTTTSDQDTLAPPGDVLQIPAAITVNGHHTHSKNGAGNSLDQQLSDVEMKNGSSEAGAASKNLASVNPRGPAGEIKIDVKHNQSSSSYTLGRHTLLSPVEAEPTTRHKRSTSDASTVIETSSQHTEPAINIKRESPPYQRFGSQIDGTEPTVSAISSFTSATTTSTALTSEDGANNTDASVKLDEGDTGLSGYDPKYGNKADYLRHQKARVKMIESIEEKNRRLGHRSEEKPQHKSPPRQTEGPSHQGTASHDPPVRGPEYIPRTNITPLAMRAPSLHAREISPNGLRRAPSMDTATDRLPPPPGPRQNSRRSTTKSFSRPPSPPLGRYIPPQRPRDYSPTRDIRPQYLPYDDPVSIPARPRPVVSSPPRGSPPREYLAPRTGDRQAMDGYSGSFPRKETRTFDLRPPPPPPAFSGHTRDSGSFNIDREDSWGLSARGLPRAPPCSRASPQRDANHERTLYGSSSLPANPSSGHRPQAAADILSTSRYTLYDPPAQRPDTSWPSRDWESSRPPEAKLKLQDRFTMEPAWLREPLDEYGARPMVRDGDRDRDGFGTRPHEREGFQRELSPRYDGLRSGVRRSGEIDAGIRPMKRSRPDDEYVSHGGPPERARYGLDGGRPPVGDYYPREPARRPEDEYIPRTRPPYNSWNDGLP